MPTVLRHQAYRFYFYSHEPNEPPHIHVDGAGFSAKFWLRPVNLARNYGFSSSDLNFILRFIEDNQQVMLEAWYDHFGT